MRKGGKINIYSECYAAFLGNDAVRASAQVLLGIWEEMVCGAPGEFGPERRNVAQVLPGESVPESRSGSGN